MAGRGIAQVRAPFGWVSVEVEEGRICRIRIGEVPDGKEGPADPLARAAAAALERWFEGGPWPTGFPLNPRGTPFQRRVWQALLEIPPGERRTYGELAASLGTGARAVGGACRANPIPLLVPCHRVVAAAGTGGFAGEEEGRLVEIKRWLLAHD